jgi:hypothetical protein
MVPNITFVRRESEPVRVSAIKAYAVFPPATHRAAFGKAYLIARSIVTVTSARKMSLSFPSIAVSTRVGVAEWGGGTPGTGSGCVHHGRVVWCSIVATIVSVLVSRVAE